jgi:hypothetical protein
VLLDRFGDEYLEEQDEAGFLISEEEPRPLAEIIEAEQEFFDKVWYVRSMVYDDGKREIPDEIRTGMMANRERVEAKYGRGELWKAIGPGHEEAWQYGYISGKLATLRWVLGSVDTVKPDVHLRRFVEDVVGHPVTDGELVRAVTQAARRLGRSPRELDAAIWERAALGTRS